MVCGKFKCTRQNAERKVECFLCVRLGEPQREEEFPREEGREEGDMVVLVTVAWGCIKTGVHAATISFSSTPVAGRQANNRVSEKEKSCGSSIGLRKGEGGCEEIFLPMRLFICSSLNWKRYEDYICMKV